VFLSIYRKKDGEEILKALKNLKPSFRAEGECEIIASDNDGRVSVGRYRDLIVVMSDKAINAGSEPLNTFRIEFEKVEMGKDFYYGKYRLENDALSIETKKDTKKMIEILPPLLSEITVSRILISDASVKAEYLTKEETNIINKITEILEGAKSLSIMKLEELAFSVSSLKGSFFSSYMRYKDELEEISYSLIRAQRLSEKAGKLLYDEIEELKRELSILRQYESSFESTLNGVRDALDTIHLKLESLHRKEDLEMQRKTSSLQAAAAVIEFIAIFYYTLGIWSKYADLHSIPKWITFSLLTALSFLMVVYTEIFGEIIARRRIERKFYVVTALTALTILAMFYVTLFP